MGCIHEFSQDLGASDLQQDDGVSVQVGLVHNMAHDRLELLQIKPVKFGNIKCLLHATGMDGDMKADHLVISQ